MIKKINYPQGVAIVLNSHDSKQTGTTAPVSNAICADMPVAKYSTSNLKANYVSFKGLTDTAAKIEAAGDGGVIPISNQHKLPSAFENILDIPANNLIEGRYYDKLSDSVASMLGPSKHMILAQDEGVMPEILIHNFAKNVKDGKYAKSGLVNYNSEVFFFNPEYMDFDSKKDNYFKTVIENLSQLSKQNPTKEKVVFVRKFEDFLDGAGKAADIENLFNRNTFEFAAPNVRIVGLIDKSELQQKKMEDILNGEKVKINPNKVKYVRKMNLEGLGAIKTKEFLKTEVQYLSNVLNPYESVRFELADGAIDALVDGSAYKYGGAFPQKALNILDMIAATEANKFKGDAIERVTINITPEVVNDFYKNNTEMLKYLKFDDSVFSFSENVKTRLHDVGGATEAKNSVRKIIEFAKNPNQYINESEWRNVPKGFIMSGSPGNGKTLLARATAGEAGVPFSAISASELVKKYIGQGGEAVREWVSKLKQAAKDSGKNVAIGFIDEIDAIGVTRSAAAGEGSQEKAAILNQLLVELDGFDNKESDVHLVFMAATNRPDILDDGLTRPGRFDSVIEVPSPKTLEERLDILNRHVKNLPFENDAEKAKILNEISELTTGKSGAEIAQMVSITKEIVGERSKNKFIQFDDMFEGLLQTLLGKKSYQKFPMEERLRTAIHEAGHATLLNDFDMKVSLISNEARTKTLGVTIHPTFEGNPGFKKTIQDMAVSYAGGDAESFVDAMGHDAGVSGDYSSLTKNAELAIKRYGLGVYTPKVSFYNPDRTINKSMEELYKDEVKKDLDLFTKTAKKASEMFLEFQKEFLKDVYLKKVEQEFISGEGGNVFSGEQFIAMKKEWLEKSGKTNEYKALKAKINGFIEESYKSAMAEVSNLASKAKVADEAKQAVMENTPDKTLQPITVQTVESEASVTEVKPQIAQVEAIAQTAKETVKDAAVGAVKDAPKTVVKEIVQDKVIEHAKQASKFKPFAYVALGGAVVGGVIVAANKLFNEEKKPKFA